MLLFSRSLPRVISQFVLEMLSDCTKFNVRFQNFLGEVPQTPAAKVVVGLRPTDFDISVGTLHHYTTQQKTNVPEDNLLEIHHCLWLSHNSKT